MAVFLSFPLPMATKAEIRMCTQSATATVRIIVGAPEEGGDRGMLSQPAAPKAIIALRTITITLMSVAQNWRVKSIKTTAMMTNIRGVRVVMSLKADSENELESIWLPVNSTR